MRFSPQDKKLLINVLNRFFMLQKRRPVQAFLLSLEEVLAVLTPLQRRLVKRILALGPRLYGFKGPYLGSNNLVRAELKLIKDQEYFIGGKGYLIPQQYLSFPVFKAYLKLNAAVEKETGRSLLVHSGYRSPGRQLMNFLFHLKYYNFDFSKTVRTVTFPGYSEHALFYHALDLQTEDGAPNELLKLDFSKTPEYKWLLKNAARFDFHLSYPQNNKQGIRFEPWHWRYFPGK